MIHVLILSIFYKLKLSNQFVIDLNIFIRLIFDELVFFYYYNTQVVGNHFVQTCLYF